MTEEFTSKNKKKIHIPFQFVKNTKGLTKQYLQENMHHLTLLIVQVTVTLFIMFFYHGFLDLRSVYVHLLVLKIQV